MEDPVSTDLPASGVGTLFLIVMVVVMFNKILYAVVHHLLTYLWFTAVLL